MPPDDALPPDPERLSNSDDVMAYLQVSRTTLWTLLKKKGLPGFKIPGLGEWRFRKAEIDGWIEREGGRMKDKGLGCGSLRRLEFRHWVFRY